MNLLLLLFYVVLWGLVLVLFLYILSAISSGGYGPRTRQKLMDKLDELKSGLVPLGLEELRELALSQSYVTNKRGSHGFLSTIFKEPILVFVYKNFPSGKVLLAKSAHKVYELREQEVDIKVSINGDRYRMDKTGNLSKKLPSDEILYTLDCNSYPEYDVIMKSETALAYLKTESSEDKHERFFSMFGDVSEEDVDGLIILVLYHTFINSKNNIR